MSTSLPDWLHKLSHLLIALRNIRSLLFVHFFGSLNIHDNMSGFVKVVYKILMYCVVCFDGFVWHPCIGFPRICHCIIVIIIIIRLHRMHEMQSSLYWCLRRLSVCLSRNSSQLLCPRRWTDQEAVWGEHSWGPTEHCVRRGFWSPTESGREAQFLIVEPPPIFVMAEARNLKFCVHIEGWGPNENYATVSHMRVRVWVTWPTFNFCDPLHILGAGIVLESSACSVCGAFDAAFAKLLRPLVIIWRRAAKCNVI